MAWLQKRPQVALPANYYTVGQNTQLMIVGLGNPGEEYSGTRHNIGFECVDTFVNKFDEMSDWIGKKDLKCLMSTGRIGDNQIIAIKPTTFMNLSGEAVAAVMNFYKLQLNYVAIIHDELDIDFGNIRTRYGGSSAGHNGVKSVTEHIGEEYGRIRIGIGPKNPPQIDSADFVLQRFTDEQQSQLANLKQEVLSILSEFAYNKRLNQETRNFII